MSKVLHTLGFDSLSTSQSKMRSGERVVLLSWWACWPCTSKNDVLVHVDGYSQYLVSGNGKLLVLYTQHDGTNGVQCVLCRYSV